jgi:Cd2+/Zn2+-exporting ATPase
MNETLVLNITGMDCADCARTIERAVAEMAGVQRASVNFTAATLSAEIEAGRVSRAAIVRRIVALGYGVREEHAGADSKLRLEGLDCADCAAKLELGIKGLAGVQHAALNFGAGHLTVRYDGRPETIAGVKRLVAEAGYHAVAAGDAPARQGGADWRRWIPQGRRERSTLVSGVALVIGLVLECAGAPAVASTFAFVVSIVAGGWLIGRAGWAALRAAHTLDMNALMTLAVLGAAAIGQWEEGATVIVLFAVGNLLEARTMDRARRSIGELIGQTPQTATRLHGDHTEVVGVGELQVGESILVRPGERIPMDGEVVAGHSEVNQAPITGESALAEKGPASAVYAGSLNGAGALEIRVTRPAEDNTLARVARIVEQAQAQRAPSQRFVDRFASIYTPAVIVLAAGVAVVPPAVLGAPFMDWLYRALVLLVIACPCALVISTPVTIVAAISNAARQGILIKGGAHLEAAGAARAVAWDKTGTLTMGQPQVTEVITFRETTSEELLAISAAIEANSEHALGKAIVHEARHRGIAPRRAEGFQALAGRGAIARVGDTAYFVGSPYLLKERGALDGSAQAAVADLQQRGRSVTLLARAGEMGEPAEALGVIGLADGARPGAAEAVRALKGAGIERTIMLTGDQRRTAEAVASALGLDEARAELLPEDKATAVEGLLAQYGTVMMVGDGVNDAPALARATVGVAMGAAGTAVALETADIALMGDDLAKVGETVRLGRRARAVIAQNVAFALVVKGAFLALAVAGAATLWMAVFADMGASLLVTLNGLRLLKR